MKSASELNTDWSIIRIAGVGFGMKRTTEIAIDAFLDGFTGAGLFGRLRRPGAPTEFVDSRTLEEIHKSGEFAESPSVAHPVPVRVWEHFGLRKFPSEELQKSAENQSRSVPIIESK